MPGAAYEEEAALWRRSQGIYNSAVGDRGAPGAIMATPDDSRNARQDPLFAEGAVVQIREPDPAAAEAQLRLRIDDIEDAVARLEEANVVPQEALRLEVSV